MKTDDLIRALAADHRPAGPAPAAALLLAALAGLAVSAAAFAMWVGLRPGLGGLVTSWAFMLKPVEMILLAAAAAAMVLKLAKPGLSPRRAALIAALAPAIMIAALAVELTGVPRSEWLVRLAGVHWYICVTNMVLLALPLLAALLVGLRCGAPTRPALAGAAAGLLAGALSAGLYISHCPDDSPIFVAAWFTLAIAIVTALGALLGTRVLRW
jgi:hypothetical protein